MKLSEQITRGRARVRGQGHLVERNTAICLAYAEGQSVENIARDHGLTTSRVYAIVKKGEEGAYDDLAIDGRELTTI